MVYPALILSSKVFRGYVGGTANEIILKRLALDVYLVPTVRYSVHPGHDEHVRYDVEPETLSERVDFIVEIGGLKRLKAIITGYFPSTEHVVEAASIVDRLKLRHPDAIYLCDPILGDDPGGLYIPEGAAPLTDI